MKGDRPLNYDSLFNLYDTGVLGILFANVFLYFLVYSQGGFNIC